MNSPEWSKKCFTIMTNELVPRAKKLGITLEQFYDPSLLGWLARLEHEQIITRKELREILDYRMRELQSNDNI